METLCKIRDIQRAVHRFELDFEKLHGICLNEGMTLCSLSGAEKLSSGELGELLGLSPSNTSKVIRSVENKGLVKRIMGAEDKRQMYFSLTPEGGKLLSQIKCADMYIPGLIKTILDDNKG